MTAVAPELRLEFGFVQPAFVYTTTIPDDPVANAPEFFVMNAALPGGETLTFRNPAGLTPDSELPELGSADRTLGRFYVYFPWGSHSAALCTKEEAAGIRLAPLSDGWDAKAMTSPKVGRYWILFPKDEATLAPQESVMFAFDAIVSASAPDAPITETLLYLEHPLPDGPNDVRTAPLTKRVPRPTVTSFGGEPMTVAKDGEVTLAWRTMGARSCWLEPGAVKLGPSGTTTVDPPHSTTYTLIATDGSEPGPDDDRLMVPITVAPVTIDSFEANPIRSAGPGAAVELAWATSYATSASIDQRVGPVPVSGSVVVTPRPSTTYTLSCEGEDGPAHAQARVVVPPGIAFNIVSLEDPPGVYVGWTTENGVSCHLTAAGGPGRTVYFDQDVPLNVDVMYLDWTGEMTLTCRGAEGTETTARISI